jgi:hypothetical protein
MRTSLKNTNHFNSWISPHDIATIDGCKVSQMVSNKTGAQLWSENCQRCRNTCAQFISHDNGKPLTLCKSRPDYDERNKIGVFETIMNFST